MNVDLDLMTNLGGYFVPEMAITFGTTMSKLLSQVLSPPELECTWITVQVFCPSTASLTPWLSSTESRPHSLSLSMLDFGSAGLEVLLSFVNSNRLKSFQGQWVKLCVSFLQTCCVSIIVVAFLHCTQITCQSNIVGGALTSSCSVNVGLPSSGTPSCVCSATEALAAHDDFSSHDLNQ